LPDSCSATIIGCETDKTEVLGYLNIRERDSLGFGLILVTVFVADVQLLSLGIGALVIYRSASAVFKLVLLYLWQM